MTYLRFIIGALVSILLIHSTFSQKCEIGWTYHVITNLCYQGSAAALVQTDAEIVCKDLGGVIASIPDQETNTFLVGLKMAPLMRIGYLAVSEARDKYKWVDGSNATFTNWREVVGPGALLCTGFLSHNQGTWIPTDCNERLNYVCQKLPVESKPPPILQMSSIPPAPSMPPMPPAVTTTIATTRKPNGTCEDKNDKCKYWSSMGYCSGTSNFYQSMAYYCRKTCNFCDCHDEWQDCKDFAQYCTTGTTKLVLRQKCRLTCNYCNCADDWVCPLWLPLCPLEPFKGVLKNKCKMTCGHC